MMQLLQMIERCMNLTQTGQYGSTVITDFHQEIYNFRQNNLPVQQYYDRFMDLVHRAENMSTGLGVDLERVHQILEDTPNVDVNAPTRTEMGTAVEQHQDELVAATLIQNSNP